MDASQSTALTVLDNLYGDEILKAYNIARREKFDTVSAAKLYNELLKQNAAENILGYFSNIILRDENVFSKSASSGAQSSTILNVAFMRDLGILYAVALDICQKIESALRLNCSLGNSHKLFSEGWDNQKTVSALRQFYSANGFGNFAFYKAFLYKDGDFAPVLKTSQITLGELYEYKSEKEQIAENIEAFLSGKPFSDMLLYGDKGTGKSSTLHAMLNYYFEKGLRFIEITKPQITQIFEICARLPVKPLKFIIYIDDLVMNEKEQGFTVLKAALEGSVSGKHENIMFAVTSNRRHIVEENFTDRELSVHFRDKINEQLSLADRFGLTVLFDSPDKKLYLKLISDILKAAKFSFDDALLEKDAERFAILKGGRSPRRAKQFAELFISQQKS